MIQDAANGESFKPLDPMYFHESGESEFSNIDELINANKREEDSGQTTIELNTDERDLFISKFRDQKNFSKSTKKMLELLCNETGFLVKFNTVI
jgi:dynein regulatory complex protein 1